MKRHELVDVFYLAVIAGTLYILSSIFVGEANAATVSKSEIERQVRKAAYANHVDPDLAVAIVQVESRFNPNARGKLGEIGLFQLRPEYHDVRNGDYKHNINVAVKYLAMLKRKCAAYGDAYFVCFNYGTARKLRHPQLFPYYKKVKTAQYNRRHGLQIAEN